VTDRQRPRVLVIARTFPSPALPTLGIWAERMVTVSTAIAEPTVVAPVPYAPPIPWSGYFSRFRHVPHRRLTEGVEVHHPRVPAGPGYLLHSIDAVLAYPFLRRLADRLHRDRPFDLIHAHFIYPDGVIAARLGQRYGIPVVTTEHAPWLPWFDDYPRVRRLVETALRSIHVVSAVSESHRRNLLEAVGPGFRTVVLPNVLDTRTFRLDEPHIEPDRNQILFVGVVRHVKGLDILVRALALLADRRPALRLQVVGAPFFRGYARDAQKVHELIASLRLTDRVRFTGQATPAEVARAMRSSAMLVVPSRREIFSAVTIEALGSGIPVIATRCGGPEEILTPTTGRLVPTEDPLALAAGIEDVLDNRSGFDPRQLHEYAAERFGPEASRARFRRLYAGALAGEIIESLESARDMMVP
jgi:teichuronic acid biosynthesis glycosyltransferase TuaC